MDDLPGGGGAVLQLHLVNGDADDAAVEDLFAFQHGLGMCHGVFSFYKRGDTQDHFTAAADNNQ